MTLRDGVRQIWVCNLALLATDCKPQASQLTEAAAHPAVRRTASRHTRQGCRGGGHRCVKRPVTRRAGDGEYTGALLRKTSLPQDPRKVQAPVSSRIF